MNKSLHNGFTLVELIVVMVIIGLLATIGIRSYIDSLKSTRDAQRYSDLKELKDALDIYYAQNGNFPSTGGAWWSACTNGLDTTARTTTGSTGWIPDLAPGFVEELPLDPNGCVGGAVKGYIYRSDGRDYKVAADWTAEIGSECESGKAFNDPHREEANKTSVKKFCSVYTSGAAQW